MRREQEAKTRVSSALGALEEVKFYLATGAEGGDSDGGTVTAKLLGAFVASRRPDLEFGCTATSEESRNLAATKEVALGLRVWEKFCSNPNTFREEGCVWVTRVVDSASGTATIPARYNVANARGPVPAPLRFPEAPLREQRAEEQLWVEEVLGQEGATARARWKAHHKETSARSRSDTTASLRRIGQLLASDTENPDLKKPHQGSQRTIASLCVRVLEVLARRSDGALEAATNQAKAERAQERCRARPKSKSRKRRHASPEAAVAPACPAQPAEDEEPEDPSEVEEHVGIDELGEEEENQENLFSFGVGGDMVEEGAAHELALFQDFAFS